MVVVASWATLVTLSWRSPQGSLGDAVGNLRGRRDVSALDPDRFNEQFQRFKILVPRHNKGHPFTNFHEGVVAVWEGYKPHLRDRALGILRPDTWAEGEIGSGVILQRTIDAIEIQDGGLTNNLVLWQNRYGHANRDHHSLLEAVSNAKLRHELEQDLFGLYWSNSDEGVTFDRLSELTGAKYPLLAYLHFLKNMDRFMPIQPTTFDRAFRDLGIDLVTVRSCSWENYQRFNTALRGVQRALVEKGGLTKIRLIDAHSFCWMLARQLRDDGIKKDGKDPGRVLGGRETSIIEMRHSVEHTVRNAYGQLKQRTVKNKELRMTSTELEKLLGSLLDLQGDRCALTGIRFHFAGPDAELNRRPSVDRIDSNGHYEHGNLQIVCRFVNFWKGDTDNEEFKGLLMLVRGEDGDPA